MSDHGRFKRGVDRENTFGKMTAAEDKKKKKKKKPKTRDKCDDDKDTGQRASYEIGRIGTERRI